MPLNLLEPKALIFPFIQIQKAEVDVTDIFQVFPCHESNEFGILKIGFFNRWRLNAPALIRCVKINNLTDAVFEQ